MNFNLVSFSHSLPSLHFLPPVCACVRACVRVCVYACMRVHPGVCVWMLKGGDSCSLVLDDVTTNTHIAEFQEISRLDLLSF